MVDSAKPAESLSVGDLAAVPVLRFASSDGDGETLVIPVKPLGLFVPRSSSSSPARVDVSHSRSSSTSTAGDWDVSNCTSSFWE